MLTSIKNVCLQQDYTNHGAKLVKEREERREDLKQIVSKMVHTVLVIVTRLVHLVYISKPS